MRLYPASYDNCLSLEEEDISNALMYVGKIQKFPFNRCLTGSINNVNPTLIVMTQESIAMLDREHAILAVANTHGRKYYFMICDTCFWCASVSRPDLSNYCKTFSCPVCRGYKIETIPLAYDEAETKEEGIDRKLERISSQFGLDQG